MRWRGVLRRLAGSVTPTGWAVSALGLAGYAGGRYAGLAELGLLAGLCAVLLGLAVVLVLLPTRVLARVVLRPTHTVAGETGLARLHLRNRSPLPLLHPVARLPVGGAGTWLRLPVLRYDAERVVEVDCPTTRRGVLEVGPVTVRRTDPLGLLRRDAHWGTSAELYVRPRMVSLESLTSGFLRDQEGAPSDEVSMSDLAFHALREYVVGDDLRHVHWRSSARAGELVVRQYHHTRRNHVTVLVDDTTRAYDDPGDFELAVSLAASLVARASLDGSELAFGCGSELVTGRGPAAILDACCRVHLAPGDRAHGNPAGGDLPGRARLAARTASGTSLVLVSGSEADGASIDQARRAFAGEVRTLVLRAASGSESRVERGPDTVTLQVGRLDDLPGLLTALTGANR